MFHAWMWKHFEIAAYVAAAIFVIYRPPKSSSGLGAFVERHFGDTVGFYILHLGIILVVIGGIYPQVGGITQTGNSLILAGMVALKLTKTNGSDNPTALKIDQVVPPKP
jgi:hypothetical protein